MKTILKHLRKSLLRYGLDTQLTIRSFLVIILLTAVDRTSQAAQDDFLIIKQRVVTELMKTPIDDKLIQPILDRMNEDGRFKNIDYADLSRVAGFPHRRHTSDLVYLAKAYKSKGSSYYKSKKLKERITTSLKYWAANDFFGDNWHNNQISTPNNLVHLMLVFGDNLPKDLIDKTQPMIGRAHMKASGARPSGDRIVIAGILAKNLLFIGDRKQFDEIIELIEGEVKFSTGTRGMQHDFSFHHRVDRVNNTTSYGYGKYANAFGEWSYYVANTKYAFSVEKINHLVDYYLDGIYKQLVYGVYTDISVKNRSITHKATFKPQGTLEIERLLFGTDYRKEELEEIIRLRKGEAKPSLSFSKFFWQTEHFVFQRPNFYTTVRMHSTRNRNMEVPYNGPGKTTHHRADGTNYLQLKGDEYHNIWPVYDWQKVSGTTVVQKPELYGPTEIQKDGLTDFVGAVTDGLYGAVAYDFRSPHDFVSAKKSWFFFDEEYVCIGTDIKSSKRQPVFTTINQVLMRSDVAGKINGQIIAKMGKASRKLSAVKWIYQDKVGYIFPDTTTIFLSNQAEEGRWSDITDQINISEELVTKDVFTLGFDHGERPSDASYQYIVIPDVSEEEITETSDDNRGIEILSSSSQIHAVKNNKLNICQLAFYQAGEVKISEGSSIKMDSQGMVMLKMNDNRINEISVADPSRKLSRALITVPGIYEKEGAGYSLYPNKNQNKTLMIVDLPQGVYAGKSVTIGF